MKLSELLEGVCCNYNGEDLEISSLTISSKDIGKNSLYFCLKGQNVDGHNFAREAYLKGAVAIVCERRVDVPVAQIVVSSSRKALAKIAGNFFDSPAKKLKIVAITGTNGKTSTAYITKKILEKCGKKVGLIGTNGVFIGRKKIDENLTTPDPIFLHKYFRQMLDEGCEFAVIEASAHAIFWNKLYSINFECIAFTNLTQDHLDFFGDMASYANVKKSFFNNAFGKSFVVNTDDKVGREIASYNLRNLKTYSVDNVAEVRAIGAKFSPSGTSFFLEGFEKEIKSNLIGKFNLLNCLCAIGICLSLGLNLEEIRQGLKSKIIIPGRFNIIENKKRNSSIIIDFAHTPDGLEKAIKTARSVCREKLICVFGCGGNRDRKKRKIMGEIAGELCDLVIITNDNPRFEAEEKIAEEIALGVRDKSRLKIELDRKRAIEMAISFSGEGDIVLIAGKGAEAYQEKNGIKTKFLDRRCVIDILKTE